jgi:hypothetical protein
MRFLADENFPRPAIEALRRSELDVAWISEGYVGSTDDVVLQFAVRLVISQSCLGTEFE